MNDGADTRAKLRPMSAWLSNPLVYALIYSRRGWPVLPVRSLVDGRCDCGSDHDGDTSKFAKHPRTEHGCLDATTDENRIRQWWRMWPNANVGIATIDEDLRLAVYDIDPRHGGHETWAAATEGRTMAPHPTAKTGGGGWHHYFTGEPARVGRDAFGPGVDIKAGNAYVIAQPSVTFAGAYEWLDYPFEPPPIPEFLLPEPRPEPSITIPLEFPTDPRYALGALRSECEQARARRDGQGRRDNLFQAGLRLSRFATGVLRGEDIVTALALAAAESGLAFDDAASHARNGLTLGLRKGTFGVGA